MVIQALGVVSSILAIGGFFLWIGRLAYRQAITTPKGYAVVLAGVSVVSVLTLAIVVAVSAVLVLGR